MVRKAHINDYDFIKGLYFHPQINSFLLYEMADEADFAPIFEDLLDRNVVYVFEIKGEKIGMFKLVPLTYRSSHIAYLGGVAIHPQWAGKGFGVLMMQEIIAFSLTLGFRRIELSTATTNEKAMHLYEKVGFQKEGVLRQYTHLKSENRYLDEVLMAYVAELHD